jgi:uncharacterized membrane protein
MKNQKIKRMVTLSLLSAIVIVLQMLGGYFHIGPVSLSLVLVPIVLGSAMLGAGAGAFLGAVFSVVVIIYCVNGMDVGGAMVWNSNPAVCFLVVMAKGVLAGFLSGLVFKAFSGKNRYLAMLLAAITAPIVNTGIFIASLFIFFKDVLSVWAGGGNVVIYVLSGLVLLNFVPELVINIVMSPASARLLKDK